MLQRWPLVLSAIGFAVIAVASAVYAWLQWQHEHWPETDAVVLSRRMGMLPRGTTTLVMGQFSLAGTQHTFEAPWGRNRWHEGRWVAPADLPAVGATIRVRYNPLRPTEVALGPQRSSSNRVYFTVFSVLCLGLSALSLATLRAPPPKSKAPR
jgi:hypothetical protein